MKKQLELPKGDYTTVVTSPGYGQMHVTSAEIHSEMHKEILRAYGELADRPLAEAVPQLAYSVIALTAWSMLSAAKNSSDGEYEFDPVAFGKRCEEIAREQAVRYQEQFNKKRERTAA